MLGAAVSRVHYAVFTDFAIEINSKDFQKNWTCVIARDKNVL